MRTGRNTKTRLRQREVQISPPFPFPTHSINNVVEKVPLARPRGSCQAVRTKRKPLKESD